MILLHSAGKNKVSWPKTRLIVLDLNYDDSDVRKTLTSDEMLISAKNGCVGIHTGMHALWFG